ncbi:MAG TPA: carboxypeptidase M32 [Gammaproteobacteria bacterium]|nr:carboxypeptidase M32 [Gammaproteobacteria bacterium]
MEAYKKLKTIFKKLAHLQYVQKIMMWDEAVIMPEGAGAYRAHTMATLDTLVQKTLIKKKNGALIEKAKNEQDQLSAWDQVNLKWMEKKYRQATCIPTALTEKLTKTKINCEQAWRKLRPQNNWQEFLPYLEANFLLVKEVATRQAALLGLSPYDALLDEYAPGFTMASIDPIFSELKQVLPSLIATIMEKQRDWLLQLPQGPFPIEKQKAIGLLVMRSLQFDFNHGRLDSSHHPFCSGIPEDVRITTRYTENEFMTSLLGICHETGHALYEQGLPPKWTSQPVGMIHSMAMHESQSLLIEMQVCRSLAYFEFLLPLIQQTLGKNDEALTAINLYHLITQVKPSLIRVDADEVTYPLHVILRYEIEKGLFQGDLSILDLPAAWHEGMQKYLGLSTRDNYKDGVMQDVHWPSAGFGYFPAYTLGRLIAAQFFASFSETHPHFNVELKQGNFQTLIHWLRKHIHGSASFLTTSELLKKITGKELETAPFIHHLHQRYL